MKRFYSTLGIDNAIKEQERDNIKANQKVNNMSKTWQERFDEDFGIGELSRVSAVILKHFISDLIAQTREETIREVEKSNKDYLKKLCWDDKDIEYFLGQYNKLKK